EPLRQHAQGDLDPLEPDLRPPQVSATSVYLVRHGQSAWNVAGRYCGVSDCPLTEAGLRQADALAAWIRHLPIDAVYASPLERARAPQRRDRGRYASDGAARPARAAPRRAALRLLPEDRDAKRSRLAPPGVRPRPRAPVGEPHQPPRSLLISGHGHDARAADG